MEKPKIKVWLANPRGFCAGVERAIGIVETALDKFGPPVYVRHQIVHNAYVVRSLEAKGARFIDHLYQADPDRPLVFSAHGVPKSVPEEARQRKLFYIDATCPLVTKVHREAERYARESRKIILIGHRGHPEVIGTMGQLPEGQVILLERPEDVKLLPYSRDEPLAYLTQTTLSLDDTAEIIAALKARFPSIREPRAQDICYATTNRQEAVKAIAARCDHFLVVGSANSSNATRLVEVAQKAGANSAQLIEHASELNKLTGQIYQGTTLGLSAGASAPELLLKEIFRELNARFEVDLEEFTLRNENVRFRLPKVLEAEAVA